MLKLEARPQPCGTWRYGSPLLALVITVIIGALLFTALGKDPLKGLEMFFWQPVSSAYAVGELLVKATPLLIIALGLAVCFRASIWNIGAEGQYVMGAIFAGGTVWESITALLRDRFNASEILVSLMLVYVAVQVLSYMVGGPWKDPNGFNFPQSKTFEAATRIPRLFEGSRVSIGVVLALVGVAGLWIFLFRTRASFAQQVGGLAPAWARGLCWLPSSDCW